MFWLIAVAFVLICISPSEQVNYDCDELLMGQYLCPDPSKNHIDPKTQQLRGCTMENKAKGMHIHIIMIQYGT